MKKDTSASVPLSFFTPLCPCLKQDLKTVMERYTWELNHVSTCRIIPAKPERFPSGSYSVLRWYLGRLAHDPGFPCTQGKPGLPPQAKRCMDFEAFRVCFCFLHEPDMQKRPLFIKEMKSGVFPLNPIALTFHLNTCEGNMTRTTESFFCAHAKNSH